MDRIENLSFSKDSSYPPKASWQTEIEKPSTVPEEERNKIEYPLQYETVSNWTTADPPYQKLYIYPEIPQCGFEIHASNRSVWLGKYDDKE